MQGEPSEIINPVSQYHHGMHIKKPIGNAIGQH
jgi:hypothetical protein